MADNQRNVIHLRHHVQSAAVQANIYMCKKHIEENDGWKEDYYDHISEALNVFGYNRKTGLWLGICQDDLDRLCEKCKNAVRLDLGLANIIDLTIPF